MYQENILVGIISARGIGKTLLLTALAYEDLRAAVEGGYKDWKIYHNGFLLKDHPIWTVPGEDKSRLVEFGIEDIVNTVDSRGTENTMQNGLVLIDEIASIQDNRYGTAYGGILFSHWVVMMRKIGLTILWAGQNEEVDRRLKMQCDIVGYPTVSRKKRGREVGCTFVYQNSSFTNTGKRRRFFYNNLQVFWDAYDTSKIIQSQSLNKRDINVMQENKVEEKIFDQIYDHLADKEDKQLNVMDIKRITGVDWEIKKLQEFVKYFGRQVKRGGHWEKGNFDFKDIFK